MALYCVLKGAFKQCRFEVNLPAPFQFSLLAETLAQERQEIQVCKKAQEKASYLQHGIKRTGNCHTSHAFVGKLNLKS